MNPGIPLPNSTSVTPATPAMTDLSPDPLRKLYRRPGFLLRRAHQLSVAIFEAACQALALTPAQFGVLTVVSQSQDIDQSTLSRALGFDRVTTLHVVRLLTQRGLLVRERCERDGRWLRLMLTAVGAATLTEAQACADSAHDHLLAPLAPAEQDQLIALLSQLCAGLEPAADSRTPAHARAPVWQQVENKRER